ncbi:MAG: 16S rRNA (uracil(1498)-N(3))-methyltransferase [Pseudomonadota bacterium]
MAGFAEKIRLFVAADLGENAEIPLAREQAHYLSTVMRRQPGDRLRVFNGRDGEWVAEIVAADKRGGTLCLLSHARPQAAPPDVWLAFAPLKKARTDFVAEKACEMGCRRLIPVLTRYTNAERVNTARLGAHAIEAAEQCGLLNVPEVAAPQSLDAFLADLGPRQVMFCDESGAGAPAAAALKQAPPGPWAVLIGPEGGFSPEEAARLRAHPGSHAVSLGPRILRADTAAVAALTVWQTLLGDWERGPQDQGAPG